MSEQIKQALANTMRMWSGLSPLEAEALELRVRPCLCGEPSCAGFKAELGAAFHVVGETMQRVEPSRVHVAAVSPIRSAT